MGWARIGMAFGGLDGLGGLLDRQVGFELYK